MKYAEVEQEDWDKVRKNEYGPGRGIVKMSEFLYTQVSLENGSLDTPDNGSTWSLLTHVHLES